jgi:putative oxidoreductase
MRSGEICGIRCVLSPFPYTQGHDANGVVSAGRANGQVKLMKFLEKWSPEILSLLRMVAAFMFIQHGTAKMFGFPVAMGSGGLDWLSQMGLAAILEVFGGTLLLVGLLTRPVALILSGEMAVAYFMAHFPNGFWTLANHGDAAVLYCFVFLYIASAGGGKWSVDRLRG